MYSEQYFSYIQDENKFNNIDKLYRNERRDGETGSMTFDNHWTSVESWVGQNI